MLHQCAKTRIAEGHREFHRPRYEVPFLWHHREPMAGGLDGAWAARPGESVHPLLSVRLSGARIPHGSPALLPAAPACRAGHNRATQAVPPRRNRPTHSRRAHKGTFHKLSPKQLQRYVNEFAGRHNLRERDTIDIMARIAGLMIGKRLMYRDLIADTGESAEAT